MDMSDMETPGPSRRKRKGGQDDGPPRKRASLSHDEEDLLDSEISDLSQVSPDAGLRNTLKPPKAGIIESVELRDFMCHKHLKVPFGRNTTIINGKNGSGKSAVLVGLAVGLGGKAAATKRGSSLKNFIREGCGSALVQINIHNQGSSETGAFQQEKYDDMIVVERRINSDGTGGYKLKNGKTRKVISSAKEDLQKMLDHFNILVDNPVCILPQDMSRNFLHSTSPKDKYRVRRDEIKRFMTDKKATLPQLEKVASEHEQQYKDLAHLEELEKKREKLSGDIAWAQVFEVEQQIEPLRRIVAAFEKRLPQYEEKIRECEAAREQAHIKQRSISEQLEKLTRECHNAGWQQKEAALQQKKALLREANAGQMSLQHKIKSRKSDRQQIITHIEQIRHEASRDRDAERRGHEEKLRDVERQLQEVNGRLSTGRDFQRSLELASGQMTEKKFNLRSDRQDIQRNLEQHCQHLDRLRKAGQDRLQVFGSNYVDLCRRIETAMNQRRFHKKPVGPLGLQIKLRDAKWALAVEACIGRPLLSGFVVDNGDDKKMLESVIRSFQWRGGERQPVIVMTKFLDRIHNISANKPNCEFPTVWDMITVDNVIAANVLIDECNVEGRLLIEQRDHAFQIIQNEANRPAKALMAFTRDGDRVNPDNSFISNNVRRVFCLQRDVEEEIRAVMNDKRRCEAERDEAQHQWDTLERQLADNEKELKATKRKMHRDQDLANRLRTSKSELENALEEEELPDVTALEEDVRQFDMELQKLSEQLVEAEEKCLQIQPVVAQLQAEVNENRQAHEKIRQRGESLKNELDISENDSHMCEKHYEHYSNGLAKKRQELENARRAVVSKQAEIERNQQKVAAVYPERSETTHSVRKLESELKSLDKRIQEKEKNQGRQEEITQLYYESSQRYKAVKKHIKELDSFQKRLGNIMVMRLDHLKNYRQWLKTRLKVHFLTTMSKRGYKGDMHFDDSSETLELRVGVSKEAKLTKDSKALSGGERSFSTVAFILSLWEPIDVPFRCLDEFDVFMDLVVRRIAMAELITAAKKQGNKQTILLTPQDLSGFDGDPDVHILRLRDPERNQTTLDFSAARGSSSSNS